MVPVATVITGLLLLLLLSRKCIRFEWPGIQPRIPTCCNWPLIRLIILIGNIFITCSKLTVSTHEYDGKASFFVRRKADTTGCVTLLLNTDCRENTTQRNMLETWISPNFLGSEPEIKIYYMVFPLTVSQTNSALKLSFKQIVIIPLSTCTLFYSETSTRFGLTRPSSGHHYKKI